MLRWALALLLVGHGLAHLPGFLVAWRLRELPMLPYTTTILGGHFDVGALGARLLGLGWLLAGLLCVTVAAGVLWRLGWAHTAVWAVLVFSSVLSALGWPASRLGLLANGVIALVLVLALTAGTLGPPALQP